MKRLLPALEILAGLVSLGLVNYLWFATDPGYFQVCPHPYLLVVLLIAGLHGSAWGVAAALGSSATLLLLGGSLQTLQSPHEGSATPAILAFFVAAVIVGQGVDFHKRARARAEDLFDRRSRELGEARREAKLHRTAYEDLQDRIVGETVTLNTVYAHARALGDLSEKAIPEALLGLLEKFTGMEQGCVYLREEGRLALAATHGFSPVDPPPPARIDPATGLAGLAYAEARLVSFQDHPHLAESGDGPVDILAAPLPGLPGESPLGAIVIRRIPFQRLNPAFRRHVTLVCDWAAAALRQARNWNTSLDRMVEDPDLRIGTAPYFERRMEEEFQRARRYNLDLAVVLIRLVGDTGAHPGQLGTAIAGVVKTIKPVLRATDILGRARGDDTLGVILAATPRDHLPIVTGKISAARNVTEELGFSLLVGAASLSPQETSAADLLSAAETDIASRRGDA